LIAALDKYLVPIPEHQRAKPIPLRFKNPGIAQGQLADALGKHGQYRRIHGQLHHPMVSPAGPESWCSIRRNAEKDGSSFGRIYQQTGAEMTKQKSLLRGILAGMAGGLAAAWMMNEFMAGLGQKDTDTGQPKEDATMKAGHAIAYAATGEHLSRAEKEEGGPIVHYTFGALSGGVYGGLAEYSPAVTSGFGTSFGGVLFSTAGLLAVPALKLAPSSADRRAFAQASPFAAHIVYGATTELVRRILRALF
jgi:uncharacterized membrane protein YagU involved in acid resistance